MPRRAWPLPWPAILSGLWAVAAAARLALLGGPLAGPESTFFAVARGWGADPTNVVPAYGLNEALWWQHPAFAVLLWPGAELGVGAFRVEHALLSALLAALVADVARRAGVRTLLAVGAGLAVALHPTFVLWGARAMPDSVMAVLALAGLRAHQAGRPLTAGLLLVAAAWTRETALLLLAALLAWTLWTGRQAGVVRFWPLELDRRATAALAAALLAPLPTLYTVLALDAPLPGWIGPTATAGPLSGLLPTAWLLLPVVSGLAWTASRPYALAGLAYPLVHAAGAAVGRGPEPWDAVLPSALAVLAAAVALQQAAAHASAAVRAGSRAAAATLAVALLVLAAVPDTVGAKQAAAPAAPPTASLGQLAGRLPDDGLGGVLGAIGDEQWDVVFLVDVGWYYVDHPFAQRAGAVGWSYTGVTIPLGEWTAAVEGTKVTVLAKADTPLNRALREVYADCVQHEDAAYVLLDGPACPGRTAALADALEGPPAG